jgi:hypothetical protein
MLVDDLFSLWLFSLSSPLTPLVLRLLRLPRTCDRAVEL